MGINLLKLKDVCPVSLSLMGRSHGIRPNRFIPSLADSDSEVKTQPIERPIQKSVNSEPMAFSGSENQLPEEIDLPEGS